MQAEQGSDNFRVIERMPELLPISATACSTVQGSLSGRRVTKASNTSATATMRYCFTRQGDRDVGVQRQLQQCFGGRSCFDELQPTAGKVEITQVEQR